MPGTRYARVAMIAVAVVVVVGLLLAMVSAPGAAPAR
jgi:putative copper export protein